LNPPEPPMAPIQTALPLILSQALGEMTVAPASGFGVLLPHEISPVPHRVLPLVVVLKFRRAGATEDCSRDDVVYAGAARGCSGHASRVENKTAPIIPCMAVAGRPATARRFHIKVINGGFASFAMSLIYRLSLHAGPGVL